MDLSNQEEHTVKAGTKNRAKGNRKKAAAQRKYAKRRLRASSGQQKF
jgi:hypothetical protein